MPTYTVIARRHEIVTFRVQADSPEEAEALVWSDGDEIDTKTLETDVQDVYELD